MRCTAALVLILLGVIVSLAEAKPRPKANPGSDGKEWGGDDPVADAVAEGGDEDECNDEGCAGEADAGGDEGECDDEGCAGEADAGGAGECNDEGCAGEADAGGDEG